MVDFAIVSKKTGEMCNSDVMQIAYCGSDPLIALCDYTQLFMDPQPEAQAPELQGS